MHHHCILSSSLCPVSAMELYFINLLKAFNLRIHATQATHRAGHILKIWSLTGLTMRVLYTILMFMILWFQTRLLWYVNLILESCVMKGKLSHLITLNLSTMMHARDSIEKSSLLFADFVHMSQSVELYNTELLRILDYHAPLSTDRATVCPAVPWYSNEIKTEKRRRRKLEKQWRKRQLPSERLRFTEQYRLVNLLLLSSRTGYYSQIINENQSEQQKL